MNGYEIIVRWSDDDRAFIADVPALPGCMAHGDSREDALSNGKEAAAFWIHRARELGRPVPSSDVRRG